MEIEIVFSDKPFPGIDSNAVRKQIKKFVLSEFDLSIKCPSFSVSSNSHRSLPWSSGVGYRPIYRFNVT